MIKVLSATSAKALQEVIDTYLDNLENPGTIEVKQITDLGSTIVAVLDTKSSGSGGGTSDAPKITWGTISQSSTDAPVISLTGEKITGITAQRLAAGTYTLTAPSGTFDDKSQILYNGPRSVEKFIDIEITSDTTVNILTLEKVEDSWATSDGVLDNICIQILR